MGAIEYRSLKHKQKAVRMRGADAISVAAAEYLKLPLCTLDAEQARLGTYHVAFQFILSPN